MSSDTDVTPAAGDTPAFSITFSFNGNGTTDTPAEMQPMIESVTAAVSAALTKTTGPAPVAAAPALPVTVRSASGSQDWIDPFVGLRIRHQLSDRWSIWLRGDYGGFEVSSDEYWQVIAGIGYKLSEHTTLALAYRIMSVDYHQGNFNYDTQMEGPNLGLIFKF